VGVKVKQNLGGGGGQGVKVLEPMTYDINHGKRPRDYRIGEQENDPSHPIHGPSLY
jgi:hypothetical protein